MTRRGAPLILVSNRGPVSFRIERDGSLGRDRGGGGLVTALLGLTEHTEALWISASTSEGDAEVSRRHDGGSFPLDGLGPGTRGRFVEIDPETYNRYYNVVANPMLWFIQHYLWDLSNAPDIRAEEKLAWTEGYLAANRAFAEAVNVELAGDPDRIVMLHDYHLYTAPAAIREANPAAFLHFFVHIPWSQPDYWRILPPDIREAILRGLLANDIIAFHTWRYARNFLLCCEDLLDVRVDYRRRQVRWQGREVWVRSYPISVNAPMFEELARTREVAAQEATILRRRRQHLVVRVDRTDLSKNTLRGFKAYDEFLDRHPEFHEDITFVALLQPSRQDVDEYVEYVAKIRDVVSHINTKHGTTDWMPISLEIASDIHRAVALYKHYDVLVVNPIFDGMNLIAKEAPLVNERDGVMILSENAGAHEELGSFAISINPFDVDAQADALHQALVMGAEERAVRIGEIKRIVRENDVGKWLSAQQHDIARKRAADRRRRAARGR
ncbi:MAG: trehalose-6-phosphate synthase [Thermoleophilia bacterium]